VWVTRRDVNELRGVTIREWKGARKVRTESLHEEAQNTTIPAGSTQSGSSERNKTEDVHLNFLKGGGDSGGGEREL